VGTLRVRILGSAAGGGLPQWNCGCDNCHAARRGEIASRTQSSIAVSADGERWLLVNASPDVRAQVQWLAAAKGRGSGVAAVALTSGDIDHAAGLLILREGGAPPIYVTPPVQRALEVGLGALPALAAFGPVRVRPLTVGQWARFADADDKSIDVEARVIGLTGRPPPYMRARGEAPDAAKGDVVAFALRVTGSEKTVLYAPGVAVFDADLERCALEADTLLFDGTCYEDDEVAALLGKTARQMGHVAVAGPEGSLAFLSKYPRKRRLYVHINNTNPILRPGTPARAAVEDAGVEVGEDGIDLMV
jgi:pyrroloquinoline quinone biosynthesis protein B